ncbi:hypothetical protein CFC51_001996 [Salmonella enterica subsp. enterica serovar Saintpaul]|nr:hypothetical protein [Salmonella enterica subsp. enterica serovar Saintpaul]
MNKAVIAIHGGAGAIARAQMSHEQELRYIQALSEIVESGQKMLEAGDSALDVVTEAVRLLEACPLFNAGIGAVYTRDGTHELDACVMDGNTLKAGAVAGVSHVRHPVLAAYDIAALMEYGGLSLADACERVVMEKLPALGGSGGLIAVDHEGNVALPFNSEGMYRAWGYAGDTPTTGIYRE